MPYDLTKSEYPLSVIFEIDDNTFHGHAKFAIELDVRRALGQFRDEIEQGWGYWEGQRNPCYVMSQRDFDAFANILMMHIKGQQAVMQVRANGTAVIVDVNGTVLDSGEIKRVPLSELDNYKGYTLLARGAFVMV